LCTGQSKQDKYTLFEHLVTPFNQGATMKTNRPSKGKNVLAVCFAVLLVGASIPGVANAQLIRVAGEKKIRLRQDFIPVWW
jgi:hypothetical protein